MQSLVTGSIILIRPADLVLILYVPFLEKSTFSFTQYFTSGCLGTLGGTGLGLGTGLGNGLGRGFGSFGSCESPPQLTLKIRKEIIRQKLNILNSAFMDSPFLFYYTAISVKTYKN